jgi:hypothetical protein
MARYVFSRLQPIGFALALLLTSPLSLAGQVCDMIGAAVAAAAFTSASPNHSWAFQDRSISDQGCCVNSDVGNVICLPRDRPPVSGVSASSLPKSPSAPVANMLPNVRATLKGAYPLSARSPARHPPFLVLFCRYLN